ENRPIDKEFREHGSNASVPRSCVGTHYFQRSCVGSAGAHMRATRERRRQCVATQELGNEPGICDSLTTHCFFPCFICSLLLSSAGVAGSLSDGMLTRSGCTVIFGRTCCNPPTRTHSCFFSPEVITRKPSSCRAPTLTRRASTLFLLSTT